MEEWSSLAHLYAMFVESDKETRKRYPTASDCQRRPITKEFATKIKGSQ